MLKSNALILCQPSTGLAQSSRLGWIAHALATNTGTSLKLAVFPELFLSGYAASVANPSEAYRQDAESIIKVQQLCKQYSAWVVVGAVTNDTKGYRNSALCIDATGNIHAVHHKCQPFGQAEAEAFVAGSGPTIFDSPFGRTGLAICFDIEDPLLIAQYSNRGADIILTPTANMRPYTLVPTVKVRSRALDNELWIAYANYIGLDSEFDFLGDSLLVNPDGIIQAQLGQLPGICCIYIPLHS